MPGQFINGILRYAQDDSQGGAALTKKTTPPVASPSLDVEESFC